MSPETIIIRLSLQEIAYLSNATYLGRHQLDMLRAAEPVRGSGVILRVSRDAAEAFRDAFTYELARIGFDVNYDLTSEGRLLEDLIDRFYIP